MVINRVLVISFLISLTAVSKPVEQVSIKIPASVSFLLMPRQRIIGMKLMLHRPHKIPFSMRLNWIRDLAPSGVRYPFSLSKPIPSEGR